MPATKGYGLKAKEARSPSRMPPKKSNPDSGKPDDQHNQGSGPASRSDGNKASADSGAPTSNR